MTPSAALKQCLLLALWSYGAVHANEPLPVPIPDMDTAEALSLRGMDEEPNDTRWFWHLGLTSAFPRIESENLVKDLYNPLMRALAPAYEDVTLVGDYRDLGVLIAPQIGLGRRIGDHLTLTFHGGWAGGKVRTKQDLRSWILFAPLHNDFEIYRGAGYVDFAADIYPLGHPKLLDYGSWRERFKASKPKVALSTTITKADYVAKVKIGFFDPFLPNIGVTVKDEWLLQSYKTRVGWEIPINKRNVLSFDVAYNFFEDLQYDFNGPILSVIWQHYWER